MSSSFRDPQRFSLRHDSAEHLPGPTVQAFASVGPAVSSPATASVSSVGELSNRHVHVNPVPAVEHVGCEHGLLVGQSGGWLELDSGTLCSRKNKDFLGPTANGQQQLGACRGSGHGAHPDGSQGSGAHCGFSGICRSPRPGAAESGPANKAEEEEKGSLPRGISSQGEGHLREAAAEAPLPPPTVEEAAAKAPAPPPPALALLPPEVPMLGVDAEEVPPQFEPQGVRTVGPTVWTIPSGVPLTVRREVESWTMETATMPTTPSFFQRMERGLSPAAAMITLHRDLTLRLEGHMAWQAPYFIRMVDDPQTKHRKPEYWYRCKVCQKWLDVAHLQGQTHSTNMQAYMQAGNPHLTAEHPLEAIPRNYRKPAGEFRRIVEAERRRTEPKAWSTVSLPCTMSAGHKQHADACSAL